MNKILLWGTFFLLFCMLPTEALRCHVCKRFELNGKCTHGESSCEAEPGQKCFITLVEKTTEALHCHVCKQLEENGDCIIEKSSCEANSGQKCIIKLADKGTKVYNKKGCTTKLGQCDLVVFKLGRTSRTQCCDHRDNCNAGIIKHSAVEEGKDIPPIPDVVEATQA